VNRRFALVFALGLSTLATVAHVDTAEAGRYRFGGSGHIRVHARVPSGGVSVGYSRSPSWYPRRTWSVGGNVWVGGYYPRYRYYRPYYYYYQPVPSYYGYYEQSYYPVAPAAGTPVAPTVAAAIPATPAPRPDLPRFGIGLFAGGVSVKDQNESSDIGVLGRFRLTPGLLIEGELGKTSYENDLRVDRRLGASLVYEIGAYNRLAPYVLAGLGAQQADVGGAYTTQQNFGEVGVGLRLALSPNLHVLLDLRAGSRATMSSDQPTVAGTTARMVSPPSASSNESEDYTRGRLSAVLYF